MTLHLSSFVNDAILKQRDCLVIIFIKTLLIKFLKLERLITENCLIFTITFPLESHIFLVMRINCRQM